MFYLRTAHLVRLTLPRFIWLDVWSDKLLFRILVNNSQKLFKYYRKGETFSPQVWTTKCFWSLCLHFSVSGVTFCFRINVIFLKLRHSFYVLEFFIDGFQEIGKFRERWDYSRVNVVAGFECQFRSHTKFFSYPHLQNLQTSNDNSLFLPCCTFLRLDSL